MFIRLVHPSSFHFICHWENSPHSIFKIRRARLFSSFENVWKKHETDDDEQDGEGEGKYNNNEHFYRYCRCRYTIVWIRYFFDCHHHQFWFYWHRRLLTFFFSFFFYISWLGLIEPFNAQCTWELNTECSLKLNAYTLHTFTHPRTFSH